MKFLVTDDPACAPLEVHADHPRAAATILHSNVARMRQAEILYARPTWSKVWECFGTSHNERRFCGVVTMHGVPLDEETVVRIPPADARRYAEAVRLHVDPHASVSMREHAAVTVRELLRVLNRT